MKAVDREVLLGFWKVHILHHASEGPIYGQWVTQELRRHGYAISPGTLYPLLNRMARRGWLKVRVQARAQPHARRNYRLTAQGQKVLELLRAQVRELYAEVIEEAETARPHRRRHRLAPNSPSA